MKNERVAIVSAIVSMDGLRVPEIGRELMTPEQRAAWTATAAAAAKAAAAASRPKRRTFLLRFFGGASLPAVAASWPPPPLVQPASGTITAPARELAKPTSDARALASAPVAEPFDASDGGGVPAADAADAANGPALAPRAGAPAGAATAPRERLDDEQETLVAAVTSRLWDVVSLAASCDSASRLRAARELKSVAAAMVESDPAFLVQAGVFHSLCALALAAEAETAAIARATFECAHTKNP